MDWRTTMHANDFFFLQFSRIADIYVIPGKLSEIHLHTWLLSISSVFAYFFCLKKGLQGFCPISKIGLNEKSGKVKEK